jgi:hypothetical protein
MMALGCIQAQSCHTGTCPTGVTTQDAVRQQALVVPDKATRVANFHRNTLHALQELVQAAGLRHPNEITAHHIVRRLDDTQVSLLSNLILRVEPGCLLKNLERQHKVFQNYWPLATAQSFQPLHEPVLRPSAAGGADNAAQSQAFPSATASGPEKPEPRARQTPRRAISGYFRPRADASAQTAIDYQAFLREHLDQPHSIMRYELAHETLWVKRANKGNPALNYWLLSTLAKLFRAAVLQPVPNPGGTESLQTEVRRLRSFKAKGCACRRCWPRRPGLCDAPSGPPGRRRLHR